MELVQADSSETAGVLPPCMVKHLLLCAKDTTAYTLFASRAFSWCWGTATVP